MPTGHDGKDDDDDCCRWLCCDNDNNRHWRCHVVCIEERLRHVALLLVLQRTADRQRDGDVVAATAAPAAAPSNMVVATLVMDIHPFPLTLDEDYVRPVEVIHVMGSN